MKCVHRAHSKLRDCSSCTNNKKKRFIELLYPNKKALTVFKLIKAFNMNYALLGDYFKFGML